MVKTFGCVALILATSAAYSELADSSYIRAEIKSVDVMPESMAILDASPSGQANQICLHIDYVSKLPEKSKIGEDPFFCGVQSVSDNFDRFFFEDESAKGALKRANVIFRLLTSSDKETREAFFEENLLPILKTIRLRYQAKFMMKGNDRSIYITRPNELPNGGRFIRKVGEIGKRNPDGSADVIWDPAVSPQLKLFLPASYLEVENTPTLHLSLAGLVFDPNDKSTANVLKVFGDSAGPIAQSIQPK